MGLPNEDVAKDLQTEMVASSKSFNSVLLVGVGKENDRSWFQNGSFSETDSVPDNFFKYSFLGRSLILLLFDPIF